MTESMKIVLRQLESARADVLSGKDGAMMRFAMLVLACWPTISRLWREQDDE